MLRPSPEPPYLREMLMSTCVKAEKMESLLSAGMPMPVSTTLMAQKRGSAGATCAHRPLGRGAPLRRAAGLAALR